VEGVRGGPGAVVKTMGAGGAWGVGGEESPGIADCELEERRNDE